VNSLEDAAARVKTLREEAEELTRRERERGLAKHERARLDAIKDESVGLKAHIEELRAEAKRRRELDQIAEAVDVSDDYTKGRGLDKVGFPEDSLKQLHAAAVKRQPMQVKAVSTTNVPQTQRVQYFLSDFPFLRDLTRVLDLIPTQQTTLANITYYRGLAAASAAAPVAEGAAKPESSPTWQAVTTTVSKVAHYARVTDETFQDFADFKDVLGREMLAGLIDAENTQLMSGSGTPPALTGLLNQSGITTRPRGTDSNLDAVFKAIQDVRTAVFAEPDTVLLNPAQWSEIRLSKDTTGNYLTADVVSSDPARLWGFPVLITTRVPAGTGVVANMKLAAKVYMREYPTLEVAPFGGGTTEFVENKTLVRAEERLALTCPRPSALVKITGMA
jgi:HK97 family phage major capsid protein